MIRIEGMQPTLRLRQTEMGGGLPGADGTVSPIAAKVFRELTNPS